MSIYLCVRCGRWHQTQASMKKCDHKSTNKEDSGVDKEDKKTPAYENIKENSTASEVKAAAEELGIQYTTKRETLAAIRESLNA